LRGYAVVEEPGRRIVAQELRDRSLALPWVNGIAFARQAIKLSLADLAAAEQSPGWVFFDRGLIDATVALQHLTGNPLIDELLHSYRYNRHVFLTPPWIEIYETTPERQHGFTEAVAEYNRLRAVYRALGYETIILPKMDVGSRVDLILTTLKAK
jgi:predicted ATPase